MIFYTLISLGSFAFLRLIFTYEVFNNKNSGAHTKRQLKYKKELQDWNNFSSPIDRKKVFTQKIKNTKNNDLFSSDLNEYSYIHGIPDPIAYKILFDDF